ncbi:MAG: hypothetical protein ACWIPJ_09430 [Polaribacter sp.]
MVIRVEYHIDKKFFIKNKSTFQKILNNLSFRISVMKFEKGMTDNKIAEQYHFSEHTVRKILSFACNRIRKNGFKI